MNLWQLEQIRWSILRYLGEAAPYSMSEPLLLQCLRCEGWTEPEPQMLREVEYLHGKGLIEAAPKLISPENRSWRISAAGRDFMAAGAQPRKASLSRPVASSPTLTSTTGANHR